MKGVDDHDFRLGIGSSRQVTHTRQQVRNNYITSNESIRENGIAIVFDGNLESVHGLLFQVFQSHRLGFANELFLVENFCFRESHVGSGTTERGGSKGVGHHRKEESGEELHGGDELAYVWSENVGFGP